MTSFTVTVKEQVAPRELVRVTVVVPTGNVEPEGGESVIVPQVSDAPASVNVTTWLQLPDGAERTMFAGQAKLHGGVEERVSICEYVTGCRSAKV